MVRAVSLDLYLLRLAMRTVEWFKASVVVSVLGAADRAQFDVALLDTFARASYLELDYRHEAANQRRFAEELIPRVAIAPTLVPTPWPRGPGPVALAPWPSWPCHPGPAPLALPPWPCPPGPGPLALDPWPWTPGPGPLALDPWTPGPGPGPLALDPWTPGPGPGAAR